MKRQVFLSAIKSFTIISLMFVSLVVSAQITKSAADNIVMNMLGNDTLCVVYSMSSSVGRNAIIMTADGEEVVNPYDNAYVYFIDDNPAANWAHACRYCFVNSVNGLYNIVNQHFCPKNHENFIKLYERNVSYGSDWPYTNYTIPQKAPSNGHLYAVLIGGDRVSHSPIKIWYNLSCVYTALVNRYGYIEATEDGIKHLIVMAPNDVTSLNPLNIMGDLNQSGGFYDSYDFMYLDYSKDNIEKIFQNLAGIDNTLTEVPELSEDDQLFVFLGGHGNVEQGNSYFRLHNGNNNSDRLYDYDLKNYVQNIKCSQMTFMIEACYSGGFIDNLMNDDLALCKNRAVHTCTDATHEGYVEQHITKRNSGDGWQIVDEFVYYWTAASLGYYPILEKHGEHFTGPWYKYDNTAIGQFVWSEYFDENSTCNHTLYDINPDTDNDGIVSMEEAFIFADNLDSFSINGYYNPAESNAYIEYPQSAYESSFTKELITLNGYKGLINDTVSTSAGHRYFLDGSVMVHMNASLKINNGCEIVGNGSFTYLPIWEPIIMPIPEAPPQRMLSVGNGLAENGDYDGASEVYMQLVSDFPNSQEAIAALKALFSIGVVNNGDFAELKDYYLDLLSDDNLGNTADNLANLCDVKMENYYDAVQWYEDKILNPNTTYSERIFAEIDLGDLYLQMNNNGNRGIQGKMAEYIPVSKEAHAARTDYLLSLLPDDIGQNHISSNDVMTENYSSDNAITISPNPVNGMATLSYTLDRDSNVAISIIDMLGNEIKHINTGVNNCDMNSYKLDLHDMPDGVYLCRIQVDGNDKGTVKIIVKH